ncbi:hypothetical protein Tco_0756399 [Tanacetum coccineum]
METRGNGKDKLSYTTKHLFILQLTDKHGVASHEALLFRVAMLDQSQGFIDPGGKVWRYGTTKCGFVSNHDLILHLPLVVWGDKGGETLARVTVITNSWASFIDGGQKKSGGQQVFLAVSQILGGGSNPRSNLAFGILFCKEILKGGMVSIALVPFVHDELECSHREKLNGVFFSGEDGSLVGIFLRNPNEPPVKKADARRKKTPNSFDCGGMRSILHDIDFGFLELKFGVFTPWKMWSKRERQFWEIPKDREVVIMGLPSSSEPCHDMVANIHR